MNRFMKNIQRQYKQIVSDLKNRADKSRAKRDSFYHKKGGYVSWGVSTTDFRLIMKKFRKQFIELKNKEALDLAWLFYKSGIEDQIYVGNFITALHSEAITSSNIKFFDKALDYFHTWGTIDDFCVHTLETLLRKFPKQTTEILRKWNKSKNMWKRRASVVAFTRKTGESGKFTNEALKLCDNLISDKEDLVQKGVGWALKDVMRGNKPKVLDYVKKLRKQGVPSVITLYALRDIKGLEKKQILAIK